MNQPGQGVAFDPAALERNIQHIVANRENDIALIPRRENDAAFGPSSRSSITAVDVPPENEENPSLPRRFRQYFNEEVSTRRTDLLLIACSFVSGVLDSAAFNAWGSFANMQTGNVVFLALGASGQPPEPANRWAVALTAIATFIFGVFAFVHACRWLGPLRRSTLVASFTLQTTAILISSLLVQTGIVHDSSLEPHNETSQWMQLVPLALLAFQAAGQIVASRLVSVDEIPTLVLTTLLADFLIDPGLFGSGGWRSNPVRNRRLATFLAMFVGAMASGFLVKYAGLSAALWLTTGVKAVVTICWLFWSSSGDTKE